MPIRTISEKINEICLKLDTNSFLREEDKNKLKEELQDLVEKRQLLRKVFDKE